jgi:uncharacterized protein (DUF1778 family)
MSAGPHDQVSFVLAGERAELIRSAAELEGMSLDDFALVSMERHARDVLADRTLFSIQETDWSELEALLDAPPGGSPRLRRLLDGDGGAGEGGAGAGEAGDGGPGESGGSPAGGESS